MIITISRQSATNGDLIAHLVSERLELPVFDHQLVEEIGRRLQVDPEIINHFDETALNPVESVLWEWRSKVNEDIYARHMRQALLRIARENKAVIVGHGGSFIIRTPDTLSVRIVAPKELRIAMYRAGEGVSEEEAMQWIEHQDKFRKRFIERHFHAVVDDPMNYDLVINLSGLTPEMAADLIAEAARMRHAAHFAVEVKATLPQYIEILAHHHLPAHSVGKVLRKKN